jgi:hypothetical protein
LKEGRIKRSEGLYEMEKGGVHCKKMKVVAQNNELKFQRLPKRHPF